MKTFLLFLLTAISCVGALGEPLFIEDSLQFSEGHKVYYRHHPAQPGEPTIVLMNGLIYELENWDEYFKELVDRGFGVVQLAYSTQPESLRLLEPGVRPDFARKRWTLFGPRQRGIEIQSLVDETMAVVDALGVDRFHLLSLSYGSIPGSVLAHQNADRVDNLILTAPAVMASHRYNAYGMSRHETYLALPSWMQYLYDAELYNTMLPLIMAQGYPPGVKFLDFFHGVYQMARSTKWFDLKDMAEVELPPTHLFLASQEDPPLYQDQIRFWELMNGNSSKGAVVLFEGAPHALPGVVPEEVAKYTEEIVLGSLSGGERTVEVDASHLNTKASESDSFSEQLMQSMDSSQNCARALRDKVTNK